MDFSYKNYSKKGYLQYLANKYGDFKVTKSVKNSDGSVSWWKHYSVLECSDSEKGMWILDQVTHRTSLTCEIILDMDENPTIEKVNLISDYLKYHNLNHCVFFTGSRGYHIHIFSKIIKDNRKREYLRTLLINKFNCDSLKYSDKMMLALEFCNHWKTGNKKNIIISYPEKWWFL
jgi:hypothetical protein